MNITRSLFYGHATWTGRNLLRIQAISNSMEGYFMHPNLVLSYPMQWSHFDLIFHLLQGFHHSGVPQERLVNSSLQRERERERETERDSEERVGGGKRNTGFTYFILRVKRPRIYRPPYPISSNIHISCIHTNISSWPLDL